MKEIPRLFYKVPLPGDCHASLAMTEYFVRNITRVCLPETYYKIFALSLFYPVQRTLCHCERKYGDPAGYCIMGPNGILCTRWEKEYASVRQTLVACDDCLVKNEAYDAEEKAHTSKRVSVIAPIMRFQKRSVRRGARHYHRGCGGIVF